MTPEQAIRDRIAGLAAVAALAGARVYLLKLPQQMRQAAVRVQLISEPTEYHARGGVGMYRSRVQVDAYAAESSGTDPYATAVALADAIHGDDAGGGLSGWSGQDGGSPPTLRIHTVQRVDRETSYEADEVRQVRCRQDYVVHWSRMT